MSTATSLGGHLTFFLFLLIPGYVSLRAYFWANIALDDSNRLDKLVYMVLGGFATLVIVAMIRKVGFSSWLWRKFFSNYFPDWLALSVSTLDIQTISKLSVVESFTLIGSQSFVGIFCGVTYGLSKYVFIDDQRQKRRDLRQPWDTVFHETTVGDKVSIVTAQDREIEGFVEHIGSPSEDYDFLLSDPKEVIRHKDGTELTKRDLGKASYHHYQDISRIEFQRDLIPEQRYKKYTLWLQRLVAKKADYHGKYVASLNFLTSKVSGLKLALLSSSGKQGPTDDDSEVGTEIDRANVHEVAEVETTVVELEVSEPEVEGEAEDK